METAQFAAVESHIDKRGAEALAATNAFLDTERAAAGGINHAFLDTDREELLVEAHLHSKDSPEERKDEEFEADRESLPSVPLGSSHPPFFDLSAPRPPSPDYVDKFSSAEDKWKNPVEEPPPLHIGGEPLLTFGEDEKMEESFGDQTSFSLGEAKAAQLARGANDHSSQSSLADENFHQASAEEKPKDARPSPPFESTLAAGDELQSAAFVVPPLPPAPVIVENVSVPPSSSVSKTLVSTDAIPDVMEAELIFKRMGLDAWFDPARLHPKVESLVYWRDPAKSGAALGGGLALLLSLACCSLISVGAWLALLGLLAAIAFRVYKGVLTAVRKTPDGHPFADWLSIDVRVPPERAEQLATAAVAHLNAAAEELRRLFLVEDLVDSLRFGVVLWVLTYIGAAFNGITLLILGYIALFTLPKAYEANKAQVDANLEIARAKIKEITDKVRAAVPLGKKVESEKDK